VRQQRHRESGGVGINSSREGARPAAVARPAAERLADGVAKRVIDVAGATLLLLLLSPLMIAIAVAIKLDSRGPVLYRCRRVGYRGRDLAMLKFRKMRDDAAGPALTLADDDRFTRVGKVLVKLKLDELPQLWNVIRGEMSLVGPRPEDHAFVELHRDRYERILTVRPGITGLCQVAFANESRILDSTNLISYYTERLLPQKVAVDEFYASTRSVRMDLAILLWTAVAVVARADVAVNRATGALTRRHRPRVAEAFLQKAKAS